MIREELIESLTLLKDQARNIGANTFVWDINIDSFDFVVDSAIKALEQESRWIPVSERLPEDHKDVLAYLSSDRISICRYNSHKLPVSNKPIGWGYLHGIGFIDFEKEHVMAWMPLPKSYSEVEDGTNK